MLLKNKILKYKIEIIVIGALCVLLLPLHIYYRMSHFDDKEIVWNRPFEIADTITFISNNGKELRASANSKLNNRPTWARLRGDFNLNGPSYYTASIFGKYKIIDSTFFYNTIIIHKPVSEDSEDPENTMNFYISFVNRRAEINLDTLHLSDIYINGVNIPEAFFINKSNSENTYSQSYKKKYRLVDEILWSKPLGLVYFRMADSTEYYRKDVFFDIPLSE